MPRSLEWFRSNGGKIAWVAFFALACHFALTFGHVHFANAGIASTAVARSLAASSARSDAAPAAPAEQTPRELAQDFCAVCSNISLANALILPVSPAAGVPVSITRDLRWPDVSVELTSRDHFHFSARGPPYA